MARIFPFRGWRFDAARIGDLASVLAPPAEWIDAALVPRLLARHPANAVRLVCPGPRARGRRPPASAPSAPPAAPAAPQSPEARPPAAGSYGFAARTLARWQAEGALRRDVQPAIYAYAQEFTDADGGARRRLGCLALARIGAGGGALHALQAVHATQVEDRRRLLEATRAQATPVCGLFADPQGRVREVLERGCLAGPASRWTSPGSIAHACWPIHDPLVLDALTAALDSRDIVIAAGHHVRAAACRNLRAHQDAGSERPGDRELLVYLAPLEDAGGALRPVHRLLAGLDTGRLASVLRVLEKRCQVTRASDVGQAAAAVAAAGGAEPLRLVLLTRFRTLVVTAVAGPGSVAAAPASAAALFEQLFLAEALGWERDEAVASGHLTYTRSSRQALLAARTGRCQCSFLMPPPDLGAAVAGAREGRLLPPRTTCFEPLVPAGLVIHAPGA